MTEGNAGVCPSCGRPIPARLTECPFCGQANISIRREAPVVVSLSAAALVLFLVATFLVKRYRSSEERMAEDWARKAEAAFSQKRFDDAVDDYRSALLYARGDSRYRLRLAAALAASGQIDQARSYLLELWEREPGGGVVNRELARLAAAQGDVELARRYYNSAIYGAWSEKPGAHRRDVRFELAEFLLGHGATAEASADLIALAADLPRDASLHVRVAALFEKAGEPARALAEYRQALSIDSRSLAGLSGAGRAAFATKQYRPAQAYLRLAARAAPDDAEVKALLETTNDLLQIDPFLRPLPAAERARRTSRAFETARTRLGDCARKLGDAAAGADVESLESRADDLEKRIRKTGLARDLDTLEAAMGLVFDMEKAAAARCGAPSGLDAALLRLAAEQERSER